MPQLPSGLRVALTTDQVLNAIAEGNLGLQIGFIQHVNSVANISLMVALVYC